MDAIVGTYRLEKSENFDEYLQKRGINWMLRQMMKMASLTKIFSKQEDGDYKLDNQTAMKSITYTFKLDQPFEALGFDGKNHRITFSLTDGGLLEKHVRFEEGDHEETYRYERDGDYLIMHMEADGIHCKRYLRKQP